MCLSTTSGQTRSTLATHSCNSIFRNMTIGSTTEKSTIVQFAICYDTVACHTICSLCATPSKISTSCNNKMSRYERRIVQSLLYNKSTAVQYSLCRKTNLYHNSLPTTQDKRVPLGRDYVPLCIHMVRFRPSIVLNIKYERVVDRQTLSCISGVYRTHVNHMHDQKHGSRCIPNKQQGDLQSTLYSAGAIPR